MSTYHDVPPSIAITWADIDYVVYFSIDDIDNITNQQFEELPVTGSTKS